jgi:hypothetical protein
MSDKQPMRAPSVPGRDVEGPQDLVVRMNESTSEEWAMVPLPARQQLGWHEEYDTAQRGHFELKDVHGVTPQELLHSRELAGADQDVSMGLTEAVTYHLEATPPPAEPPGAPGTDGYNRINRGVPPAADFEHPAAFTLEQGAGVRTFRLPEGVGDDTDASVEGTGPYMPAQPRLYSDPRNQSDNTRQQSNQTPSVNDPYRNPDGSLKDPSEVQEAAPAHPESDFGSKDLITDDSNPQAAVDTEGARSGDDAPNGTISEILEWVGDDQERARAALEAEQSKDKPRPSLVSQLNDKL